MVECHELSSYTDAMLVSINEDRSLASMLGGGDYNGGKPTNTFIRAFAN